MKSLVGVDQSLSNIGFFKIDVADDYHKELKDYLILLNSFINSLNVKPNTYSRITKKIKNVSFNFLSEIQNSNYTTLQKVVLETTLKKLELKKQAFSKNYPDYQKLYSMIENKDDVSNESLFSTMTFKCHLIQSINKTMKRLNDYKMMYSTLIENYEPEIVAMEGYSYGSTITRSLFELGELAGMIKLFHFEKKITTVIISPSTLKKFITGKGNSDKDVIKKMMIDIFNLKFNTKKDDDLYDSIGLTYFLLLIPFLPIEEQIKIKVV